LASANNNYDIYPLTLQCFTGDHGAVKIEASYNSRVITSQYIYIICSQFEHVITQLVTKETARVSDITLYGPQDLKQILQWNTKKIPRVINSCADGLISDQARRSPNKEAVHTWDGGLSYGELDLLSTRLALRLVKLGVRPEVMVERRAVE
jgi:non-ribosomal peptide synthetase component F